MECINSYPVFSVACEACCVERCLQQTVWVGCSVYKLCSSSAQGASFVWSSVGSGGSGCCSNAETVCAVQGGLVTSLTEKPAKVVSALHTGQWAAICETKEGCPGRTDSGDILPVL